MGVRRCGPRSHPRSGVRGCGGVESSWRSLLVAAMPAPRVSAQNVQAKDLLPRVADYIRTFIDSFSNVVAEEAYKQEIRRRGGSGSSSRI